MEKPFSLLYIDTKKELAETIKNSNLPPIVLFDMVKSILDEITLLSERVYQEDLKKYNEQQEESAK